MRFLILNTDYPEFLRWLYGQNPGLGEKSYDEQLRVRMESLFGVADFYSSNLSKLGHEAWDVHINNEFMQRRWAEEHGLISKQPLSVTGLTKRAFAQTARQAAATPLRHLKPILRPVFHAFNGKNPLSYEILSAQIQYYKPDVVLNQAMDGRIGHFFKEMKKYIRILVGQIASPLPQGDDYGCYDLLISSLPNFVDYFRQIGIVAELHLFGFEPGILSRIVPGEREITVSFVGSLSVDHTARIQWLEHLCRAVDIEVWGHGVERLPKDSWIRKRYRGSAWGIEMYRVLSHSKIAVNHHIGVAGSFANNMRLFEATGLGCLLMTDWKVNLNDLFRIDTEVLCFRRPEECAETIRYYLGNPQKRESIAQSGQKRALRDHTYARRMDELAGMVQKYI